jgi:cobalt-zinc-cadmium efflux system outer membrane protein
LNWSATLGVELELAGQRGARREAAGAEREAQLRAREGSSRQTALAAWQAYFEVLAASETARLSERLEAGAKRVFEAARAGAERGLFAGAEADLAEAAYVRVTQRRIGAERQSELSRVTLVELLGLASTRDLVVQGTLSPLPAAERAGNALGPSPSAAIFEAESRAFAARADAERRSRVPSPTLSVFAQRDGFNERVVGVGVAVPLALPEPLGRLRAGEIAENEALSRRAHFLAENARRAARARLLRALARYDAAKRAVATYTAERLQRAATTLASLSAAVEAGRLGIRDALILQDPLLEQLLGDIEARLELCNASAELLLATNVRLEDGAGR